MSQTTFDDRTEKLLKTLTPRAEQQARTFLQKVRATNLDARIISATRTYTEQDALFAQGRSTHGSVVTNARGGFSNHNFAIAWDLGIFDSHGNYLDDGPQYRQAGKIGRDMGLEWGGDWHSIVDEPHFQCQTGKTLGELRAIVAANGGDITHAISAIDKLVQPLAGESLPAPAAAASWSVRVDGEALDGVFYQEGAVWVPARQFALYLRGQESTQHIGFDKAGQVLTRDGKPFVDKDGKPVAAQLHGSDAFAPVRRISDAMGGTVTVDAAAHQITVK